MPHKTISRPRFDFSVSITGAAASHPTLSDTTAFLYDFNLMYELARLASDEAYIGFRFSGNAVRRNGRSLRPEARLRIRRLNQQSPIELQVVVGAILAAGPSILALVKALDMLCNMPIDKRKRRAEVEKLERANRVAARKEAAELEQELEDQANAVLNESPASHLIEQARRRLSHSSIVITQVRLEVVEHDDTEDDE